MGSPVEFHRHFDVARLPPGAIEQFEIYLELLLKWNGRMNLTAVRRPEEIIRRHLAESVFAARQLPEKVKTLLDFGSGAGLPGIPIAICRPEIGVTLAESQGKKAAFLREAVRSLGMKAEVWADRVEAMSPERVFDVVTLRAVDKMAVASRIAVRHIAEGGLLLVFVTHRTEGSLEKLGGIRWVRALAIPGSDQGILKLGLRTDSNP